MASIYGTGFGDGATVTIGGVAATSVVVVNQLTITCTTPAHAAGAVDVVVTNLDGGTATLTNGYTYVAPSWYTLDTLPAELVGDATSLDEDAFHAKWDSFVGADFVTWLLTFFSSFHIYRPVDFPIHWYVYSYPSPGSLWTATTEPSPYGWFQSTDNFASASMLVVGTVPHNPRSFTEIIDFATGSAGMLGGFPGVGVNFRNHFIYASGGYTVGTTSPSLRLFDGLSDRVIISLPNTAAGVTPKAIVSLLLVGDTVYLSTFDSGTTSSNFAGRVFSFKPLSGELAQIGADFTGGELPYALCWHMGRLWCGTNKSSGAGGKVYFFRPDIDTTWTTDYTLSTSSVGGVCSLASYGGQLYIGSDNSAGNFAKVLVRDALGAYTTSETATGGTARVNNGYLHLVTFQGNLYATYWNPDTPTAVAKIRKYTGSAWSTAYTGATTTLRPYINQYISGSTLLVIGGGNLLTAVLLSTPDGTTYTNRTSSLSGTSTASPIIGEVVI